MDLIATLAEELNLKPEAVDAAVKLIDEGNTIPFIARYRKEATGGMDDVALRALDERLSYLRNLEKRKQDVLVLIDAQGKLTPELEAEIRAATQLQRVEDLYKPYRKKRMTRAQKAREAGLEPLANMIFMQVATKGSALDEAARFVTPEAAEAGFDTPEKALAGAADIVAEVVAEDAENVADLRAFTEATADIVSVATNADEKTPYEPYALLRLRRARGQDSQPPRARHRPRRARGEAPRARPRGRGRRGGAPRRTLAAPSGRLRARL